MLYTAFAPIAALVATAIAAPAPLESRDPVAHILPRVKLAGSPLDGKSINAAHGGFYIGQDTVVGPCALSAPCDTYPNITALNFSQENRTAIMDVDIPGGQNVYVARNGQLSYTPGGAPALPLDGHQVPFTRYEYFPTGASPYAAIVFDGQPWLACPVGDSSVYQVFAQSVGTESACTSFQLDPYEDTPTGRKSTWQYS